MNSLQWIHCNEFTAMNSLQWIHCNEFTAINSLQWIHCNEFTAMNSLQSLHQREEERRPPSKPKIGPETFVPDFARDLLEMFALDRLVFWEGFRPNRRRFFSGSTKYFFDRLILHNFSSWFIWWSRFLHSSHLGSILADLSFRHLLFFGYFWDCWVP